MKAAAPHWTETVADRVLAARAGKDGPIVCASGISPSGPIHLGNLREVLTPYFVAEANPAENKLSNESPVGKAIIGHKKGDVVEVSAPRGALKFKILEIKAA